MHDVVGRPYGAGVARRVVVTWHGDPHGAGARAAALTPRQDALAGHVEADRRDGDVELVADRLEGLAAGYALGRAPELLVRTSYAAI